MAGAAICYRQYTPGEVSEVVPLRQTSTIGNRQMAESQWPEEVADRLSDCSKSVYIVLELCASRAEQVIRQ